MLLEKIIFKNFRNFDHAEFQFNPFLTVVIGENSQGKTNLLEGIYFLINGSGFRESKEDELLNLESQDTGSVEGVFKSNKDKSVFTINLIKKDIGLQKVFQIQRTKKKLADYLFAQSKTVLFSPEQIEIIIGSPDVRRDYFNKLIGSFDPEYKKRLRNFEQALRRRNKLLESYLSFERLKADLNFWNSYLEEQAVYLTKQRTDYINFLNQNKNIGAKEFSIEYLKSEFTKERAGEYLEKDMRVRRTLIGPQKDEFQIYLNLQNVHHLASRSEQRFAVFWLKVNEIKFYEEQYGRNPILLLDDIFSELDVKNKKQVLDLIKKYQTVATTTELEVLAITTAPKSIIRL